MSSFLFARIDSSIDRANLSNCVVSWGNFSLILEEIQSHKHESSAPFSIAFPSVVVALPLSVPCSSKDSGISGENGGGAKKCDIVRY